MSDLSKEVEKSLKSLASKEKAVNLARFFKTGKGQYGEGDKFMGIVVPDIRRVAKEYYKSVTLDDVRKLIKSPFHEVRLCAVIMLVYQYEKADESIRQKIYDLYLTHTRHINNWDLVDLSAPNIVGEYLLNSMFASPRHRVLSCLSEASCEGGLATHPSGGPHRRRKTGVFGSNLHTKLVP